MNAGEHVHPLVTVLWHSTVRREAPDGYLIKEVWGWYLEEALAPVASRVTVVASLARTSEPRFQEYRVSHPSVSVVPLNEDSTRGAVRRTLSNLRLVTAAVRDADVVWAFMPAWKSVYGTAVARVLRKPVVAYFGSEGGGGNYAGHISSRIRRLSEWFVVRSSECVLVADANQIHPYESLRPGRVLRRAPAIPISRSDAWRRDSFTVGGRPIILFVGSVDRNKGIDVLVEAVRLLQFDRRVPVRLIIIGPQHRSFIEGLWATAEMQEIADCTEFTGYIPNGPKLYDYMKQSDVFVLPSRSEGFPRVLYEAMAHGLPIVATRVGSIEVVMTDHKDCLLVERGDPQALASALERVIGDSELRRTLAENAYSTFERELSTTAPEQVADVMASVPWADQ